MGIINNDINKPKQEQPKQHQSKNPTGFPLVLFMTLIVLMSLLGLLSSNLYLLELSDMASYFNTSTSSVQTTISLYVLGFAISQVLYGTLSDRFGRKIVMIYGIILYIIASLLSLSSSSVELIDFFRFLQGLGAGGGMVVGRAILNDLYPKEKVAQILTSIFPFIGSMPAFGPLIGGYISFYFNWQANFIVFIVLGIIILLLLIFVLKETIKEKTSISFSILINNYKSIITKKLFMKYALILMFTTGTYFIFLTNAVFMFKNLNSSLSLIYFYYALVGTSSVAGNLFAKVLLRLLSSIDKVMLVAVIINIFVGVTMLFFIIIGKTNTIELIVLSSITSFTNGILVPLAYTASAVLFPKLLGSASGVAGLLQIAGASLGGAVISYFYLQNIQVLLVLVPIITLLLMLLMLSILKEKRTQSLTVR